MEIGLKAERAGRVVVRLQAAWLCGRAMNVKRSIDVSSAVDRLAV